MTQSYTEKLHFSFVLHQLTSKMFYGYERFVTLVTDVRAAISGILYEAKRALKAGRIVRLGDLGSLQIGLNSEGAVSVKEFSSSLITAAHIIFRPGKTLADITKILSYQQVTTRAVAQTGGSGNEGEDDDKGSGGGSDGGGSGEAPDPAA